MVFVAVAAWPAIAAPVSSAKVVHNLLFSFNGGAPPAGPSTPRGVAVDNSTGPSAGDVYVEDAANLVVNKFSTTASAASYDCQITSAGSASGKPVSSSECAPATAGTPEGSFGNLGTSQAAADGAVDPATGDVWIPDASASVIDEFNPSGAYLTQVAVPAGVDATEVAVDSSGNLYVSNLFHTVEKYDPAAATWTTFATGTPSGSFGFLFGIAVDNDPGSPAFGDVYVADGYPNQVVDVFSSSGAYLSQLTASPRGRFGWFIASLAVDPGDGHLYVAEGSPDDAVDEFDPTGAYVTTLRLPSGAQPAAVAVAASSGDVYVTDPTDGVVAAFGPDAVLADAATGKAVNVGETAATVAGTVNPDGVPVTDCHFEYASSWTAPARPLTVACVPAAGSIPGDSSSHTVTADITGLTPGTGYHFRLVVGNATGINSGSFDGFFTSHASTSSTCPNAALRSGPSANLPDCRAYEQVTPVNKGDTTDMFAGTPGFEGTSTDNHGQAADNGNSFVLGNTVASFGTNSTGADHVYDFSRSATGWTTTSLATPGAPLQALDASIFNPSLSEIGIDDLLGTSTTQAENQVSHYFGAPGGPYTALPTTPYADSGVFVGASTDFSHVVLESTDHSLVPAATAQVPGSNALYEWTGGQLRLVNVNTDGSLTSPCGAILGYDNTHGMARNAVSADGSKIFFVSPDPRTGSTDPSCYDSSNPTVNPPQLYMRLNGTTTVELSAPNPDVNDPDGPQPVSYAGASADGSKVFFVTTGELTIDDSGIHDPELYEYNTDTSTLTRVSRGTSGTADGSVGWTVVSQDGSTVYFAASGQLAPGASSLPGAMNLYRYDTATGATTFITTVSGQDWIETMADQYDPSLNTLQPGMNVAANWYTTPDGRYLVFGAVESLTGFDNFNPADCIGNLGTGSGGGGGCAEIYRYDSADGSLTCVSCAPDGALPTSDSLFARDALVGTANDGPPRPISNDGSYVFFDTANALVPQDTNGKIDVYEWHNGTISLISSGQDANDSFFLDSSADGHDVFFGTHAQLVAQDTDQKGDLYDARIDGGSPAPPTPPAACLGDGCHGPLSPTPTLPTAATIAFAGQGDTTGSSAPSRNATVVTRTVRGSSFFDTVRVPASGRLAIAGRGVRTITRSIARAGTERVLMALTAATRRRLRAKHRLRLMLTVRFAPAGGPAMTASVPMTVKA